MDLSRVVKSYFPNQEIRSIAPFGNGHINTTYKIDLADSRSFILQKINSQVFTKPQDLVHNHKLLQDLKVNDELEIPKLVRNISDQYLLIDDNQNT